MVVVVVGIVGGREGGEGKRKGSGPRGRGRQTGVDNVWYIGKARGEVAWCEFRGI